MMVFLCSQKHGKNYETSVYENERTAVIYKKYIKDYTEKKNMDVKILLSYFSLKGIHIYFHEDATK